MRGVLAAYAHEIGENSIILCQCAEMAKALLITVQWPRRARRLNASLSH